MNKERLHIFSTKYQKMSTEISYDDERPPNPYKILIKNEPFSFGTTLKIHRLGKKKSILLCAFDRPQVKNAFNDELYNDLTQLLNLIEEDDDIHGIVLTGVGNYFSSGADLSSFHFDQNDHDNHESMTQKNTQEFTPSGKFMMKMISFPKLICAAVNGPAIGIGVTLLLHCDIVYCREEATFWTPFTRIALVPEFCSSVLFPQVMGLAKANELLLMGKQIDAEQAVSYNIVAGIIKDCEWTLDPFSVYSIASFVCKDIDERLLSLCHGEKTSRIFISMVRTRRSQELREVCRKELNAIAERLENGEVLEAAMDVMAKRSKL